MNVGRKWILIITEALEDWVNSVIQPFWDVLHRFLEGVFQDGDVTTSYPSLFPDEPPFYADVSFPK